MRSSNQKVKVIRHQSESKHLNWVPRFCQRGEAKMEELGNLELDERKLRDRSLVDQGITIKPACCARELLGMAGLYHLCERDHKR